MSKEKKEPRDPKRLNSGIVIITTSRFKFSGKIRENFVYCAVQINHIHIYLQKTKNKKKRKRN